MADAVPGMGSISAPLALKLGLATSLVGAGAAAYGFTRPTQERETIFDMIVIPTLLISGGVLAWNKWVR